MSNDWLLCNNSGSRVTVFVNGDVMENVPVTCQVPEGAKAEDYADFSVLQNTLDPPVSYDVKYLFSHQSPYTRWLSIIPIKKKSGG